MSKMIASVLGALFFIAGCSHSSEEAYAAIVFIDGKDYIGQNLLTDNKFTVKEKVGEVKQRLDKDIRPEEEWSSNAFEEESEIYSVNEKDNVFLIKVEEDKYQILTSKAEDAEL
ncbi:hypothetical protein [Domibacillus iocasae]|uniref:Lipoprotein n=1 Tax=Domibacillus iocasae TaxID=1714016 RepID=A0A1E7DQM8_9BACI|nr:hypothetical protein [Domibacillus iocasae]OES45363.1 hypothetical protein BA724_05000 [Domibacillus iocasae]